jgi:uncharacterized membrane protein YgdD (TMEM256/DUF423 family)
MKRKILITALILGVLAIVLGAFGAHALKNFLNEQQLISYETGVRYQMYHALFLLFLGSNNLVSEKALKIIGRLTVLGVIFFSGSIYLLTTSAITQMDFKFLGPITPIGGLLLISAWILVLLNIFKNKR